MWAVGIVRALDDKPLRLTAQISSDATAAPERIARAMRRFVNSDEPMRPAAPVVVSYNYGDTLELLLRWRGVSEETIAAFDDHEVAMSYGAAIDRAVEFLLTRIPRVMSASPSASKNELPAYSLRAAFGWHWTAAAQPAATLDNLAMGVMSAAESETMAAIFPRLYEVAWSSAETAIGERAASHPNWVMPGKKERALLTFLGLPAWPEDMAKAMQKVHAEPSTPTPRISKINLQGDIEKTASQRAEAAKTNA